MSAGEDELKHLWENPSSYNYKTFDNTWKESIKLYTGPEGVKAITEALKSETQRLDIKIEEKQSKMIDPRKQKIRELKEVIKKGKEAVTEFFTSINIEEDAKLSEEEQKEKSTKFKDNLALKKAEIKAAEGELKLVRLNKTGSSFFEWTPNLGMNRQQARKFRRERKKYE